MTSIQVFQRFMLVFTFLLAIGVIAAITVTQITALVNFYQDREVPFRAMLAGSGIWAFIALGMYFKRINQRESGNLFAKFLYTAIAACSVAGMIEPFFARYALWANAAGWILVTVVALSASPQIVAKIRSAPETET